MAAAEWAEAEAGLEVRAREAEERELARVQEVRVPAAEVCGRAARAGVVARVAAQVQVTVVAQVLVAGREQAEAELGLDWAAEELARAEVGERVAVRVEVVRVRVEEQARAREEADSAEAERARVQGLAEVARVLVLEAEDLGAGLVRVAGLERAEAERARAERERQGDG